MSGTHESMLETPRVPWIVPFLLLLVRERGSYGQDLAWRVTDLGFEDVRPRVAYRIVRQMERDGLVFSERDESGRTPRRGEYSITEAGEAYLEFWANSLARYREPVELFLKVYAGEATREEVYG